MSDPSAAGWQWQQTSEVAGYWSLYASDDENEHAVEVCLEPTVFGRWLLAVYVHGELAHKERLELGVAAITPGGPLLEFRGREQDPGDELVSRPRGAVASPDKEGTDGA